MSAIHTPNQRKLGTHSTYLIHLKLFFFLDMNIKNERGQNPKKLHFLINVEAVFFKF